MVLVKDTTGYHHVDICSEHQKYLGFQCYIFTELMRPLVRLWHGRGLKAIVYLDDGIIAAEGKSQALKESARIQYKLQCAGFVAIAEKSLWDQNKDMEWLGFIIDLAKGEFAVPEHIW